MEAHPHVGDIYQQEYAADVAEDMAQVLSLDATVSVAVGDFDGVLETAEWSPLEPGVVEDKYYALGIGEVFSMSVSGEQEFLELVEVQRPHNHGPR
jgi:hypothetical protein